MPSSVAQVATDRPERYLKQLASHFGHKAEAEIAEQHAVVRFGFGVLEMDTRPGTLVLRASADDADALARTQDVGGRHLERFGDKDGLVVAWGVPAES